MHFGGKDQGGLVVLALVFELGSGEIPRSPGMGQVR